MSWVLIQRKLVVRHILLLTGVPISGVPVECSLKEEVRGDEVGLVRREALDFMSLDDDEGEPCDVDEDLSKRECTDGCQTGANSIGLSDDSLVVVSIDVILVKEAEIFTGHGPVRDGDGLDCAG